jgi:hypothetical protein
VAEGRDPIALERSHRGNIKNFARRMLAEDSRANRAPIHIAPTNSISPLSGKSAPRRRHGGTLSARPRRQGVARTLSDGRPAPMNYFVGARRGG